MFLGKKIKSDLPTLIFLDVTGNTHVFFLPNYIDIDLFANNKGIDQSTHPHTLFSVFAIRCLDSILIKILVERVGMCLTWSVILNPYKPGVLFMGHRQTK